MASIREFAVTAQQAAALLFAPQALQKPLAACRVLAVATVKERFFSGVDPDERPWKPLAHPRPRGGNKPLRDRGLLMASITATSTTSELVQGTNLEYAGLHQSGGVVRPKRGKFLAIPLTREAVTAGSPRRFRKELSPRFGARGGVLVEEKARGDVAHYALVRSVTIPPRPFLGFGEKLLAKMDTIFLDFIGSLLGA